MGISVNWLKDYVDFDWSAEELAHRLTMAGIAIEGVEKAGDDSILELDLTPNRGDCQGVINIAREIAALQNKDINTEKVDIKENSDSISDYITVEIEAPELCERYTARLVKNVKIKPSPDWMQERLINSGIRPINNIVDITNYVLMESNQPLHAFDYDLLSKEKKIVVRRAKQGEKITTLDEVERELDEDMLLITDAGEAVALAGIMGGMDTEINDNTVNVLIESAYFKAASVRKTSRKLALRTDSSMRFEKGLDINGLIYALNRAAALMQELGDGEVVSGICDAYPDPRLPLQLVLRPERVNFVLGTELSLVQIRDYIESLKFRVSEEDGKLLVFVPSYRPDIEMEVDLIEEVARLHGYENIESTLPYGNTTRGGLTQFQSFREDIELFMANYLNEVITYSFITPRYFDQLCLPSDSNLRNVVHLENPLSEEQSVMRSLLLPGLLDTLSRNLARKNSSLAFFEIGSVFLPQKGQELPDEVLKLGAVVAGRLDSNWLHNNVEMDFYYLKGIVENLMQELGIEDISFVGVKDPSYHPGRSALIISGERVLGVIGEVHPTVRQSFAIKPRACAFELDMKTLFELSSRRVMKNEITRYPAVERDLAILAKNEIQAMQVIKLIKEYGGELLQQVVVFDLYSGEQVPEGFKSLAFRISYQSNERTLTEEEVNLSIDNVVKGLEKDLDAHLR